MNLFRKEVIEEKKYINYGGSREVLTERHEYVLYISMFLIASILIFICFFEYGRKIKISGYVNPSSGIVKVYSPNDGYIRFKYIKEGQKVYDGVPLAEVESYDSNILGRNNHQKYVEILRSQLEYIKNMINEEIESKEVEGNLKVNSINGNLNKISSIQKQKKIEEEKRDLIIERNNKYDKVFSKGFMSNEIIIKNKLELLQASKSIEELIEEIDRIKNVNDELKDKITLGEIEHQKNINKLNLEYSKKQLEIIDLESKKNIEIKSNVDGNVSDINFEVGQEVKKNDYIMSILPSESELEVILMVPPNAYGYIRVGDDVDIRFRAFPYEKHGTIKAKIKTKSDTISLPREIKTPIEASEGFYRVVASLESETVTRKNESYSIKSGMIVEVSIVTEKKKILDWLLAPFHEAIHRSEG
ncbi:HlyD family efflux transporter periplasmic adaptor subunit [Vibrio sp. S9_S30]|uniref:HlyD family efflux transporter periplasmic adaptor subunit n=1 Tax=Vibrio sp. S9_S30 TaxID=2720226 RepID=UPI0016810594|nr:HlyD family efflux transporter periplasmic adaptor subunit [Vibrio sp. S9_S30]